MQSQDARRSGFGAARPYPIELDAIALIDPRAPVPRSGNALQLIDPRGSLQLAGRALFQINISQQRDRPVALAVGDPHDINRALRIRRDCEIPYLGDRQLIVDRPAAAGFLCG